MWELAVGEGGTVVKGLTVQEVGNIASAMGALRDWKRIIKFLGSEASPAREALPTLDRRR